MQSTCSIPSWQTCYYYPVPIHLVNRHLHPLPCKITPKTKSLKTYCRNNLTIGTHSCSKEQENKHNHPYSPKTPNPYQDNHHTLHQDSYSSADSQKPGRYQSIESEEGPVSETDIRSPISSNMWWADFRAALGQRINVEGITTAVGILTRDKHLVMPHVTVPDIRHIDWAELKDRGFEGVVFDKDNTITVPYSLRLWTPLRSTIDQCKSLFGNNIAVFSNSAGLLEYDHDGRKARILEDSIGIKVIRHRVKKPAGTAEEIENYFGCESNKLIMVGDRPFTDIAYGNRNGFFTILTEPLSVAEDPFIVKKVRLIEVAIVKYWAKRGFNPTTHMLVPESVKCVKDVPIP